MLLPKVRIQLHGLLFVMLIIKSDGLPTLCELPNDYLEIQEGKDNNTFICTGFSSFQSLQWKVDVPSSNSVFSAGKCNSSSCNSETYGFSVSKASGNFTITVNETAFELKTILQEGYLTCQIFFQNTASESTRCPFDYISPAQGVSCSVLFNESSWTLSGLCSVTNARSARSRYICLLYQTIEGASASKLVGNFTISAPRNPETNFWPGTCPMSLPLPPQGKYNYSVTVFPGKVQVSPTFLGTNEIRRPSQPPSHNCSQYVQENNGLQCVCVASDLGKPSGSLLWKETGSPELKIAEVKRTSSGVNYTCSVMWNNTAEQRVTYTLIVNYSSSVLSFKMADKEASAVEVSENANVSVVCKADGRPLPTIRLLKVNDSKSQTIAEANNTQDLVYNLPQVRCESAATYVCQSENIVKGDERRTDLTVTCAPREATTNATYAASFKGEEALLEFDMISRPEPNALSLFYIGSVPNGTALKTVEPINGVKFQCNLLKLYVSTCSVTLRNKANFDVGFYSAVFRNAHGNLSFTFEIKNGTDLTTTTAGHVQPNITGPVVGGIIAAVVAIIVIVLIICIVRRKGGSKKDNVSLQAKGRALSEEQNDGGENKDVYAAVVKKNSKQTSASSTKPTQPPKNAAETTPEEKPRVKKGPGKDTKDKRKRKGDKQPLAQENTELTSEGTLLSMSPMTGSEYANFGFDEKEGQERKAGKKGQRRNQEDLNYTTVVFSNTANTPTPLPQLESTEYASIVPLEKP